MGEKTKKKRRWPLVLIAVILLIVLALTLTLFFYYPHYLQNKSRVVLPVKTDGTVTVMSCNVRCLSPLDLGKKSWFYRADLIMRNIEETAPEIIGFQEVTKSQYKYLQDTLPGYDSVITYRDESLMPEGCPVFYRSDGYELVDKGSFWLSETPDSMSRDWGAANYRICSYVILREASSGKEFAVFNTHLDHVSDEARVNGIQVVLDKLAEFGGMPAILMGDLNAAEDSLTYSMASESFLDVKYEAADTMQSATYQAWGEKLDDPCIDYILISQSGFTVEKYAVVDNTYNGIYPSDHFPIYATLRLE